MSPIAVQGTVPRRGLLGPAAAVVTAATAMAYATLALGDLGTSPRLVFVVGWFAAVAVLAAGGAWLHEARSRAIAATAAGVGMIVAGSAGLASFGLPVAIVGVLEGLGALASLERAAETTPRVWLGAAAVAIGTVVLFAIGIVGTSS